MNETKPVPPAPQPASRPLEPLSAEAQARIDRIEAEERAAAEAARAAAAAKQRAAGGAER